MTLPDARVLLLGLAAGIGCGPTGSSVPPPPPPPAPTGWIYNTDGGSTITIRTNAATGESEPVVWPNPPIDQYETLEGGSISPIDGDVAEQGNTGRLWDQTYILDVATGVARDFGPPEVVQETDFHWSPDGTRVLLLRHTPTFDTRPRLVLLDPVTGANDTLLTPDDVGGWLYTPFWIGADTVGIVVQDVTPPYGPSHWSYLQIAVGTGAVAPFTEIEAPGYIAPQVSADRRWMTHWVTPIAPEPDAGLVQLRLYDRTSGDYRILRAVPSGTREGFISVAISPDSRFAANCPTDTVLAIYDLATAREISRYTLPHCEYLDWSWGPERPPDP